jgi:hypothetical protein
MRNSQQVQQLNCLCCKDSNVACDLLDVNTSMCIYIQELLAVGLSQVKPLSVQLACRKTLLQCDSYNIINVFASYLQKH